MFDWIKRAFDKSTEDTSKVYYRHPGRPGQRGGSARREEAIVPPTPAAPSAEAPAVATEEPPTRPPSGLSPVLRESLSSIGEVMSDMHIRMEKMQEYAPLSLNTLEADAGFSKSDIQRNMDSIVSTMNSIGLMPTKDALSKMYNTPRTNAVVANYQFSPDETLFGYRVTFYDKVTGVNLGWIKRIYEKNDTVDANYMKVTTAFEDSGIGTDIVLKELQGALLYGKKKVHCLANINVGGYLWACVGFDFKSNDIKKNMIGSIKDNIKYAAQYLSHAGHDQVNAFSTMLEEKINRVNHAWELAELTLDWNDPACTEPIKNAIKQYVKKFTADRAKAVHGDTAAETRNARQKYKHIVDKALEEGRLGKIFMLGSSWDGTLDLGENTPSRQRLEKYMQTRSRMGEEKKTAQEFPATVYKKQNTRQVEAKHDMDLHEPLQPTDYPDPLLGDAISEAMIKEKERGQ